MVKDKGSLPKGISTPVVFISREYYPAFCDLTADDPKVNPPTYDQWLKRFEYEFERDRAAGLNPVKVPIKPSEMAKWCVANGRKPDSLGRSAYVLWLFNRVKH